MVILQRMNKFTFPSFETPRVHFNNYNAFTIYHIHTLFYFSICGHWAKIKKNVPEQKGPKIFETVGDSLRKDSVVYYETEIGYIMPDLSPKFKGKWTINVMRRQARAIPDSLTEAYLEFYGDTLFSAFVGCYKLSGKYIIKGPTIKFTISDTALADTTAALSDTTLT